MYRYQNFLKVLLYNPNTTYCTTQKYYAYMDNINNINNDWDDWDDLDYDDWDDWNDDHDQDYIDPDDYDMADSDNWDGTALDSTKPDQMDGYYRLFAEIVSYGAGMSDICVDENGNLVRSNN